MDKKWSQIKVGDVVRVEKDKEFPSDLLLLASSKEIVFVDTRNLDGETYLKEKFVYSKDFNKANVAAFYGEVVCDPPNESLDEWDGNVHSGGKVINCK